MPVYLYIEEKKNQHLYTEERKNLIWTGDYMLPTAVKWCVGE